jgi:hypothetical protein
MKKIFGTFEDGQEKIFRDLWRFSKALAFKPFDLVVEEKDADIFIVDSLHDAISIENEHFFGDLNSRGKRPLFIVVLHSGVNIQNSTKFILYLDEYCILADIEFVSEIIILEVDNTILGSDFFLNDKPQIFARPGLVIDLVCEHFESNLDD